MANQESAIKLYSLVRQITQAELLTPMMKHYAIEWIEEWCQENGWTDLVVERHNNYWAFPPYAVMPEPIPHKALRVIKAKKGLTSEERWWSISAVVCTILAVISTYLFKCPMPIIAAFAFSAVTVAQMEVEDA